MRRWRKNDPHTKLQHQQHRLQQQNPFQQQVITTIPTKWYSSMYLLLVIILVFLYSIYLDTVVGSKLFVGTPLTQTKQDNHLSHILPKTPSESIPPPSDLIAINTSVVLKPTMGSHRYSQDAIFAIGDGLTLKEFALFIVTLRNTGFEGDIVFSTWPRDLMPEGVFEFLNYHSQAGVVVYEGVVIADNEKQIIHPDEIEHTKVWLRGLYGIEEKNEVYFDPRPARSLGIARFELYWVWSGYYNAQSRILLIDAKDTYFQPYGEIGIGVGRTCSESSPSVLSLYEENSKIVKLGSIENRAQIVEAYKDKRVMWFLHNVNVLTPASTHGAKKAIEAYLRAMVQQFDDTGCTVYQCDWAFHNYIYSFGILAGMDEIDEIKTHMQGSGAVNSIGYNIPLNSTNHTEIFNNETVSVLNRRMGHGQHNSWAVHQYERDPQLREAVEELSDYILTDVVNYSKPFQSAIFFFHEDEEATENIKSKPVMGVHRPDQDAIFSFSEGNYYDLATFVLSARKTGFEGDIVLNIPLLLDVEPATTKFLEHHSNHGVVVYEGFDIEFVEGSYAFKLDEDNLALEVAKYEYFYIWSHNYDGNQILIVEGDFAYFQTNPFLIPVDCGHLTLNLYEEHKYAFDFDIMKFDNKEIWNAMLKIFGLSEKELHATYRDEYVLNPNSLFGHQYVLKKFLTSLIALLDDTACSEFGCHYAAMNYIWYKEISEIGSPISVNLRSNHQGVHAINPGIPASVQFLEKRHLYDSKEKLYLNWSGEPSPVILNYQLNIQLASFFNEKVLALEKEFPIE